MRPKKSKSSLAIALRIIGVVNALTGISGGGTLAFDKGMGGEFFVFGIIIGLTGCLICFALAKCTQAAMVYLNSITE